MKTKHLFFYCTITLLLAVFLFACKKPDKIPISCTNNTMPLPQMAKDYFMFKNGTYWVYKNTSNNQTDSFYVTDFVDLTGDNKLYRYGNELNKCYQSFNYKVNSFKNGNIDIGILPFEPRNEIEFNNQTFFIKEIHSITKQLYTKFAYTGDDLILSGGVLESSITLIDSMDIGGNKYYNIINIVNTNLGIDYTKESYYAKNIGLIKFTTNDNQTYELINYNINQ